MSVTIDTPDIDAIASGARRRAVLCEASMRAEQLMRPYVPIRDNTLRPSAQVSSDFPAGMLIWNVPYAADQYHVTMNHTDPKATDHWDEAMMSERGTELSAYVALVYAKGVR